MGSRLETGQVWREDDKRMERYVVITGVFEHGVAVRTVVREGRRWVYSPRSRDLNAKAERFGKKGGYVGPVGSTLTASSGEGGRNG